MNTAKIKSPDEMTPKQLEISSIMHQIADHVYPQLYDAAALALNKFTPMDTQQGLGYLTTMISHVLAGYVKSMKIQLADQDDCYYSLENILQYVFEAASAMLETKMPLRKQASHSEIKRVKPV